MTSRGARLGGGGGGQRAGGDEPPHRHTEERRQDHGGRLTVLTPPGEKKEHLVGLYYLLLFSDLSFCEKRLLVLGFQRRSSVLSLTSDQLTHGDLNVLCSP